MFVVEMLKACLTCVAGVASPMRVVFECRDFLVEFCGAFVLVATATSETLQFWHTRKAHVSITVFGELVKGLELAT